MALGEHVGHADDFEHRAHRTAGDHAGTFRRGLHEHLGRAVAAFDRVMQRALLEAHLHHATARLFHRLLHRDRHFLRLALADADAAIAVADHRERRETEDAAALHHLGDAVDPDHLFLEAVAAIVLLLLPAALPLLRHMFALELEAAGARGFRERLHTAMKTESGTIERDALDTERLRLLRDALADEFRSSLVAAVLQILAHV